MHSTMRGTTKQGKSHAELGGDHVYQGNSKILAIKQRHLTSLVYDFQLQCVTRWTSAHLGASRFSSSSFLPHAGALRLRTTVYERTRPSYIPTTSLRLCMPCDGHQSIRRLYSALNSIVSNVDRPASCARHACMMHL